MMPLNDANTETPMMPKSVSILAHKIWSVGLVKDNQDYEIEKINLF